MLCRADKIAQTTQALRGLGYSNEEIEGIQAELKRAKGASTLEALTTPRVATNEVVESDEA